MRSDADTRSATRAHTPLARLITAALVVVTVATVCGAWGRSDPAHELGFASTDDAFSAAEATYRDYLDLANSGAVPDVSRSYLVDGALAAEEERSDDRERNGVSREGDVELTTFRGRAVVVRGRAVPVVTAEVCLDHSRELLIGGSNTDLEVTAGDEARSMRVQFRRAGELLLISKSEPGGSACTSR
jgi:hypothetical protein